MPNDRSDAEWQGAAHDAASVIAILGELERAVPRLYAEPFSRQAQVDLAEVLNSSRLQAANAAASRITALAPWTTEPER